ncbi:hypothetical protein L218DRAFT_1002414 [Marasmius fiardii PR-910]|nr:hypothetical protein L218DRAFT_1002414 [Marasmius fiardii PR-910]
MDPKTLKDRKQQKSDWRLHFQILKYVTYIQATPSEKSTRYAVYHALRDSIKLLFGGSSTVELYGSVATGLELPTTDMDLSLTIVKANSKTLTAAGQRRALRKLQFSLEKNGLAGNMEPRLFARVPVLRAVTSKGLGSIGIDITVNSPDGPKCAKCIRYYLYTMPALRPLIFVLKSFLSEKDLNNAAERGLSSYSLTCMCISFLQLNPKDRPKEYFEDPYKSRSLGILLKDFLQYYAVEFPYADSYISVRQNKLLPKASVDWITNTTPEGLAIECLVQDRNDVGRATKNIQAIRDAFKSAADTLQENETGLVSIMSLKDLSASRPETFPDAAREWIKSKIKSSKLPTMAIDDLSVAVAANTPKGTPPPTSRTSRRKDQDLEAGTQKGFLCIGVVQHGRVPKSEMETEMEASNDSRLDVRGVCSSGRREVESNSIVISSIPSVFVVFIGQSGTGVDRTCSSQIRDAT